MREVKRSFGVQKGTHAGRHVRSSGMTCNIVRMMSKRGYCSRSEAIQLVKSNVVQVNGKIITDPGYMVSEKTRIEVNNKLVHKAEKKYMVMNKPKGCLTTRVDEQGRKTVYSYVPESLQKLFPVGRLDKDSEGLLLFTNDTQFGEYVTNPKNKIIRTYHVLIEGTISPEEEKRMAAGADIGQGEMCRPIDCFIRKADERGNTLMEISLYEGKNREIRRMMEIFEKKVIYLKRIAYGSLLLGNLKVGDCREVTKKEICK